MNRSAPSQKQPNAKKRKLGAAQDEGSEISTASTANDEKKIMVQFLTENGEKTGPNCQVGISLGASQLQILLNDFILKNEERLPYSFFTEDTEISTTLEQHILANKIDTESVISIVYKPQALFRVKAVSRCTASLTGHSAPIIAVNFSPDGTMLVSGSGDSTLRFWDLNTSTALAEGKSHKKWIICLAFSPDSKWVASGSYDGGVVIWEAPTGKVHKVLPGHSKWVTALAWEPYHLNDKCRRVASASKDDTVKIWDITLGRADLSLSGHTASVTCLRWGGEGYIYTGSQDRTIKVYNPDGSLLRTLTGHAHWVNTMALNTDYALRTGPFRPEKPYPEGKLPDDAKEIARTRWLAAKGAKSEKLVTGSDDFTMFLWEPATSPKPIARMTGHQQLINQVLFSPDGRTIASASFDKSIRMWDGATGKFLATLRSHVGAVYQIAWSSDSRMLCSGSKDSTLKVWDVQTKKVKEELPGHADEVYAVDWSPDGETVCSGGKDHVLKLWRN